MILLSLFCLGSFEYFPAIGPGGGMGAGLAVASWRNSLGGNPALTFSEENFAFVFNCIRLYSLEGVNCGLIGVKWNSSKLATAIAVTSVGFDKYYEHDALINFAAEPLNSFKVGIGIHSLIQRAESKTSFLPQFDAGIYWRAEHAAIAITGRRLNEPRLPDGSFLGSQFCIGGLWEPIRELKFAIDLKKYDQLEKLSIGGEFEIFPEIAIRCGVETFPLIYHGGLQVKVGVLSLEYSGQYHPEIGDSHSVSVVGEWH
ncbi:MAG: hypothetical protein WHU95_02865 [candidate division WOR-3 bacterium]|jgi:hypothetical protein|nr:hypothetical protein [candidate division WOR-3 bacterium]MDH7518629.1 hypothetical protein [bacterium]